MKKRNKQPLSKNSLKELQTIPGVGKSIANDLLRIGIQTVNDLKNKDPEKLYNDYCNSIGYKADRCLLYVFRCAVYYASRTKHEPSKLLWWNWKDKK